VKNDQVTLTTSRFGCIRHLLACTSTTNKHTKCLFMVALWNRADHYILSCSSFLLLFLFSSSNLSHRRFDACHSSTHGVALMRIQDAGLKRAARGSLKVHDAKNRHLVTLAQFCRAISSQLRHVSTIRKKLVKQQYLCGGDVKTVQLSASVNRQPG